MSRCQISIGSLTGSVSGRSAEPPRNTRWSGKLGMNRCTGSFSSKAPSSTRSIAATDVIGFVIE